MQTVSLWNLPLFCGLAVILILAGSPAVMAGGGADGSSFPGSNITVLTNPEGAAVYVNGEFAGNAPAQVWNLSSGTYVIDIRMNGYNNETFQRALNGTKFEIGVNLEQLSSLPAPTGNGSVAIDSTPGGASVLFDGASAGTTPSGHAALVLNDVPAGNHTVSVSLAGYPVHTETVMVRKNHVAQVIAEFVTPSPSTPGTPATAATTQSPLSPAAAVAAIAAACCAASFRRS